MGENAAWPQSKSAGFMIQQRVCSSAQDPLPQTTEDDVSLIAAAMDKAPAQKAAKNVHLTTAAKERLRLAALCPNGRAATLLEPNATDSASVIKKLLEQGYGIIDRTSRPSVTPPPPRLI